MHPPFYHVDHRVGADPHSLPARRSAPTRLDLSVPPPGYPLAGPDIHLPPVVPTPAPKLRVALGLWLMAAGRALAGETALRD